LPDVVSQRIQQARGGQKLDLSGLGLTSVPDEVRDVHGLSELTLAGNSLVSLPPWIEELTQLQELNVSENRLVELPSLSGLHRLIRLFVQGNELQILPAAIGRLRRLQNLDASGNGLVELPPELGLLRELEQLRCSDNKLERLPSELGELVGLTLVDVSGNRIDRLPDVVGRWRRLTWLDVRNNNLTELPPTLGHLPELVYLLASGNRLTRLPESMVDLPKLILLDLSDNPLHQLPGWLGRMPRLSQLVVDRAGLTSLPPELAGLSKLTVLSVTGNALDRLPPWLDQLGKLTVLRADRNRLTSLPDALAGLVKLLELSVAENELTVLPDLGRLTRLARLDISANRLGELPAWLRDLPQLETLRAGRNRIDALPPWAAGLDASISLRGNPLAPELVAAERDGWPEVRRLLGLMASEGRPVSEAKVVLVGDPAVGKTSLLAALRGEPFVEGREPTQGIEVKEFHSDPARQIRLNGWDVGGHSQYLFTQALFFTAPAVYLAVWSPRSGSNRVGQWIEQIRQRAGEGVAIHVVMTHAAATTRFRPPINESELRGRLPEIVSFHTVDSQTLDGIESLRAAVVETARRQPHVHKVYPESWLEAIKRVETSGRAYLMFADYVRITGLSETDARSLARFANAIGRWIHYKPAVTEIVVLDPDWLLRAVALILDHLHSEPGALVSYEQIGTILRSDGPRAEPTYPDSTHLLIRDLLERFDIAYTVIPAAPTNAPIMLFTELLPEQPPASFGTEWQQFGRNLPEQTENCEVVTAAGPVPLDALMPQLIAHLNPYSLGRKGHAHSVHWRFGLVLECAPLGRALIQVEHQRLVVTVRHEYPATLMAWLTDRIRQKTEALWPSSRMRRSVACGQECADRRPGAGLFDLNRLQHHQAQRIRQIECTSCSKFMPVERLLGDAPVVSDDPNAKAQQVFAEARAGATDLAMSRADQVRVIEALRTGQEDALSDRVRELLARAEEQYRRLRDLDIDDDPFAREGPIVMTVEPIARDLKHPNVFNNSYRVVLWCEHSRLPMWVLGQSNGRDGRFEVKLPKRWVSENRDTLRVMSAVLKLALPLGLGTLGAMLPTQFNGIQLGDLLDRIGTDLDRITEAPAALTAVDPSRPLGEWYRDTVRRLRALVKRQDDLYHGLTMVEGGERVMWVHPRFEADYLRRRPPRHPGRLDIG
jgi:Leucine-rich repeat (LRR) protein